VRSARLSVVLLLVGLALAGCQQSGIPSGASPAPLAPANALIYLELTVRPQGAQRTAVESAITRLIGHSPDAAIQSFITKALEHAHLSFSSDIGPWLGQRIGIVVTSFSPFSAGLIAPTDKPAAALRTIRRLALAKGALKPTSYRGVHYEISSAKPVALGTVGSNLVVASPPVFREIIDADHGRSVASTPAFTSAMDALPRNALVRGYVDAGRVSSAIRHMLGSLPGAASGAGGVRHALDALLAKFQGTDSFSLSAAPRAFTLDLHSSRPHGGAADVRGAPGQSWLALASSFNPAGITSLLSTLRGHPGFAQMLARVRAHLGVDLLRDVLPALGPYELSIQGTSPLTLGAGLVMKPSDAAAAGRLLAAIRRLAARSPSLIVQGSNKSFTITKAGLPIPRIQVAESGDRVVATVDESFSAVLSPSTHLTTNPRFTSAVGALAPGSRVAAFVDFHALAQLLGGLSSFMTSSNTAALLKVLGRLDYLVAGSDQAHGNSRLVLALN
jgi:Protein of unknown function (DUF3352)